MVEGVSARLATDVDQLQEEVRCLEAKVTRQREQRQEESRCLEAEVTWQREEVRRLRADVDGKPPVSLIVFLPEIHGMPFDTVGM